MSYLRQSTTVTIKMGPFLDKTDGVTEETGLTPAIEVSKAEANFVARNSATAVSHDAEGWYNIELDTTDTATAGSLIAKAQDSATHIPVRREFEVLPANVYDSMFGSDKLQVDLTQIDGLATNGNNATLNLKKLNIVNNSDDAAVHIESGGSFTNAALEIVNTASFGEYAVFISSDQSVGLAILGQTTGAYIAGAGGYGVILSGSGSNAGLSGTVEDLRTLRLDHLLSTSVTGSDVADNSVIAKLASASATADWDTYDNTTDSLQANQAEHDATQTAVGSISVPSAASVADAVWDETRSDHVAEGSFGQSFAAVVNGQATTGTLSTTQATTNLTEATDNHYNDRVIVWVSGVLAGQACQITDYDGSTKKLTYTTLTEAPSNGDKFVIV